MFVVNELGVDFEPPQGCQLLTDQWFNLVPPQAAEAYRWETAGTVFRYRDGVVTPDPGYVWYVWNGWEPISESPAPSAKKKKKKKKKKRKK